MFWRLTAYFVAPSTPVVLPVLNGTFSKSENSIGWERVTDLSVTSPSGRVAIDSGHWRTIAVVQTHQGHLSGRYNAY
jgi:hypothetical protein